MKKIVFIIPNMTGGGTERSISMLSDEFVKQGHEVAVMQFAGYEHAYDLNEKVEDFSVSPVSHGNPFIFIRRIFAMRKYFKQNPDCYIFAFCVMGAFFSVIAAMGLKRHILVAERSNPSSSNVPRLRDWAYEHADVVTFQTEDGISYYSDIVAKKAIVIPNPAPLNVPERFVGERKKRVVTVARLVEVKNQRMLLESFSDFLKKFPDYELHFFGAGELEGELKAKAEELGIQQSVVWHGFCKDVASKIIDSRMFVLSSNYEGISNSMVEALSIGLPTICTDCPVGGARVYIRDGENGLLVPVKDRKALAEAMERVAADDALAEKLSVNAAKIKDEYSIKKIAERFLEAADFHE